MNRKNKKVIAVSAMVSLIFIILILLVASGENLNSDRGKTASVAKYKKLSLFKNCSDSKMSEDDCLRMAVEQEAVKVGKVDYCDGLPDEAVVRECRLKVAVSNSLKNNNTTECTKLDTGLAKECKEKVFGLMALKGLNENTCQKIESETVREDCLRAVYYGRALKNKDKALCDKVGPDLDKKMCVSEVEAAIKTEKEQNNI